jgi:hypothetical protein
MIVMKRTDFGMLGSDYTGTKIALSFAMKGLTMPSYIISIESKYLEH